MPHPYLTLMTDNTVNANQAALQLPKEPFASVNEALLSGFKCWNFGFLLRTGRLCDCHGSLGLVESDDAGCLSSKDLSCLQNHQVNARLVHRDKLDEVAGACDPQGGCDCPWPWPASPPVLGALSQAPCRHRKSSGVSRAHVAQATNLIPLYTAEEADRPLFSRDPIEDSKLSPPSSAPGW